MKRYSSQEPALKPDLLLLGTLIILLLVGIVMVYDATVVYSFNEFGGKFHFLLLQSGWVTVGLVAMFMAYLFDYHLYPKFALPLMLGTLFLLLLVFVPGLGVELKGAHRWIGLGSITVQPGEIAKLSLVIYLASWLSADRIQKKNLMPQTSHQITAFLALMSLLMFLILKQPNFSMAVILGGIGVIMYFISGAPKNHIVALFGVFTIVGLLFIITSSYRMDRLITYLKPGEVDLLDSGYHISQVKIALGSGGIFGKGLGQSRQKYEYLPEVHADSIFAIVGEELGFMGTTLLIAAFVFFIIRGLLISARAPDMLGKLLAVGITSWFMLQIFVNLSAMVGLVPLTGVTLPFISCGGSATVVTLTATGVLLNVSRYSWTVS